MPCIYEDECYHAAEDLERIARPFAPPLARWWNSEDLGEKGLTEKFEDGGAQWDTSKFLMAWRWQAWRDGRDTLICS